MLSDFIIPFMIVGLAELGDKTQITMLALSTRFNDPYKIFTGSMLAFLLVDGTAIALGSMLSSYISISLVHLSSGVIFLAFGIYIYFSKDEEETKIKPKSAFISSFAIIFLAELGDKTQVTSLLFATHFNPWIVLVAVMIALATLTATAIILGTKIKRHIKPKTIKYTATTMFILFGLFEIYSYLKIV
ncbi:MAG: TMEM165/GDT1 family protein [DPANN group archaeon]|nr:TMEM165/GDT1 family protein [DPANN group archaeon]